MYNAINKGYTTMTEIISRKAAHAAGLKRFYTGKPCIQGHLGERYTSSGNCIECVTYRTPNKHVVAPNAAWPTQSFAFTPTNPMPSYEEMQAALRYLQDQRWHDAALDALRKDPALMAQYVKPPSPVEIEAARAVLQRAYGEVK
jgi:hypothetical protein